MSRHLPSSNEFDRRSEQELVSEIVAGNASAFEALFRAHHQGMCAFAVRMVLRRDGNWTGAVTDATLVPTAFVFNAIFSTNTTRENLDIANQTITRSESSVFGTVYAANNKEPRATWDTVRTGTAVTKGANGTPVFRQTKYKTLAAPVALTKGTEMLLLRAEAALRAGDVAATVTLINQERATFGLPALAASTVADARTALQSERGYVLWLEGRRLWDLRRWFAEGTSTFLQSRDKCLPPSADEQASNPNLR